MILSGYSQLGAGSLQLHRKLAKKLTKELGVLLKESDEGTQSQWRRVQDWLKKLV